MDHFRLSCVILTLTSLLHFTAGSTFFELRSFNVLKFGDTAQDYIRYKPDMQSFERAFTICAWIKNLRNEHVPNWFSYATSSEGKEISITDNGYQFFMFGDNSDLRSSYTVTPGLWFHNCVSWSAETQTRNLYIDGVLVDSKATPAGRTLGMGGYVVFGNEQDSYNDLSDMDTYNMFSGEMFNLNVFSTMLPTSEIQEMARDMCFNVEENYGATRHIRWEDVIQLSRTGNVVEKGNGCPELDTVHKVMLINLKKILNELNHATTNSEKMAVKLDNTLEELATATAERKELSAQVNKTLEELATATADRKEMSAQVNETLGKLAQLNRTVATALADSEEKALKLNETLVKLETVRAESKQMSVRLIETASELETVKADSEMEAVKCNMTFVKLETVRSDCKKMAFKFNMTIDELATTKLELDKAAKELEGAVSSTSECPLNSTITSPYDFLYSEPFYEETLTMDRLAVFRKSLKKLEQFVGVRISSRIIEFFKLHARHVK